MSVRLDPVFFAAGEAKSWSVSVPTDLSARPRAHWILGIPPNAASLGIRQPFVSAPEIVVFKSTEEGSLSIINGSTSTIRFQSEEIDTVDVPPGTYWQQWFSFDDSGRPILVAEGPVTITPSFLSIEPIL